MHETLACLIVMAAGLYLCALAAACLFAPAHARRFLLGFAQSRRVHFTELLVRIVVGGSLVTHAPRMLASEIFVVIGWILLATSPLLLVLPWR
ncbi:MAG TPA: hypothetical protein VFN25_03130 [Dokdonella sp.]|uniref:hypothetical protein n=1 Tax=Dokdonella sp. TaxID=2291710 RepID=UPI002D7E91F4|nr:hypothetical protein [Dokdonella sp.]HET9031879.1 hypothetical protein [Dokdonella sp.]